MKRERVLFVYNPNAGKAKISVNLALYIGIFTDAGYEVIAHPTRRRLDAKETVMEYLDGNACDRIVCAGGDGTLNEVVSGMMESGRTVPIGYLPAGTTNDFAYSLRLPKDRRRAATVAVGRRLLQCDVGKFQDRYFTYTAAFGLFTDVSYDTPQNFKNALGRTAYILNGISRLPQSKAYSLKLNHDGVEVSGEFLYGMVANTDSVGGFRHLIKREVHLDDGYYEMLLVRKPQNLLELQAIITDLTNGTLEHKDIYYARVRELVFEAEQPIPWALDGEFGGEHAYGTISVIPQAISYAVKEE